MAISDVMIGNMTTLYVVVIAGLKFYGSMTGRTFGCAFVLLVSTAVVGVALLGTLIWDVSRKAAHAVSRDHITETCKGGICWHGFGVKSSASQVRFRLPNQNHYGHLL